MCLVNPLSFNMPYFIILLCLISDNFKGRVLALSGLNKLHFIYWFFYNLYINFVNSLGVTFQIPLLAVPKVEPALNLTLPQLMKNIQFLFQVEMS